jgi:hypothetical protein
VIASIKPIATRLKSGPAVDSESGWTGAVGIGRRGDRQRPVGPDAQAQVEPFELEPADLDLQREQRPEVEPDPAARRRQNGPAGGVANGNAAEAEREAAVAAHQGGRTDRDDVARAESLLQAAGDARVEAFEVDRPGGEQQRQAPDRGDNQENCDDNDAEDGAARALPQHRLTPNRQRGGAAAPQQMPYRGPRPGPRRCVDAADQTPQVSACSARTLAGRAAAAARLSPRQVGERRPPARGESPPASRS